MVHMDTYEVIADGLQQQRCHHRTVYAARESQQHLAVAHLLAHELHLVGHEILHVPVGLSLTSVEDKVLHGPAHGILVVAKLSELHVA